MIFGNFVFLLLIILIIELPVTQSQMTFSDGWGKRSAPLEKQSPSTNNKQKTDSTTINNNVAGIIEALQQATEEGII